MRLKGFTLPTLKLIFCQAVLNIYVVYQMLIITNVPVNSASLYQFIVTTPHAPVVTIGIELVFRK